ncbi:DUF6327 family protein [Gillisia limnaea]|uniref:Glutaminyl-tRNA synthetase n=1 Tax=Gillisia limnaea (strain DSM 15749 / LMG 21470 / R-8282) TaxID=865937 RepID=H2BU96_GILLR|nr:DUF6327 family protein [Gillisia limnaea]EHQ02730.1 glutaminyl-tRNA synthetase [Gillisia limnaea DSM 15749]
MKEYSSFDEIERDLKILKLQTQIDKEEIKLSYELTKYNISPLRLIGSMVGSVIQKALVLKGVSKVFGLKKVITSTR